MTAHVTRRYHFSASHRLHTASLSPEQNQLTFGKCNNPFGHGHNYVAAVTYSGPVDPTTGMVVNIPQLDAFAEANVLSRFDQMNLNTLDIFSTLVPTTENVAVELHEIFKQFPQAQLHHIHVEETGNNSFDYSGGALPPAATY